MNAYLPSHRLPRVDAAVRSLLTAVSCAALGAALFTSTPSALADTKPAPARRGPYVFVTGWVETLEGRVGGAEVLLRTRDGRELGRTEEPTGDRGTFYVQVYGQLPEEFVAEARGGSLGDDVLSAVIEHYTPPADKIYIDPATTLVARDLGDHPPETDAQAEARVRKFLGLGGYPNLSTVELSENPDLNTAEMLRQQRADNAEARGGLSRFISRLEKRMNDKPEEPLFRSAAPGSGEATLPPPNYVQAATTSTTSSSGSGDSLLNDALRKPSVMETEVANIAGMSITYQFLTDNGVKLAKNLIGKAIPGADGLLGFVFDALGLGSAPDPDKVLVKEGLANIQLQLSEISTQITSLSASVREYAVQEDKNGFDLMEADVKTLKTSVNNGIASMKFLADRKGDTPQQVLDAMAIMRKYRMGNNPDLDAFPDLYDTVTTKEQIVLRQLVLLRDEKKAFTVEAEFCRKNMGQFPGHLIGGGASEKQGGYTWFNRIVLNSQYFWTQPSTERMRRYFMEYDFYQAAQYDIVMEYVSSKYGYRDEGKWVLIDDGKDMASGYTDTYRAARAKEAEMMKSCLVAPPNFEAVDPRTGLAWFSVGGKSLGRGELALNYQSIDVTDLAVKNGDSLTKPKVNFGAWNFSGNQEEWHIPSYDEIRVLKGAWESNKKDRAFYAWLWTESGREAVWTKEQVLKATGLADITAANWALKAPQNNMLKYGSGVKLEANSSLTEFKVNYWPDRDNTSWWTSSYQADDIPRGRKGMLYDWGATAIIRFDAGSGAPMTNVLGKASDDYSDYTKWQDTVSIYPWNINTVTMIEGRVYQFQTNKNGIKYTYLEKDKKGNSHNEWFGAVVMPVRKLKASERYWQVMSPGK